MAGRRHVRGQANGTAIGPDLPRSPATRSATGRVSLSGREGHAVWQVKCSPAGSCSVSNNAHRRALPLVAQYRAFAGGSAQHEPRTRLCRGSALVGHPGQAGDVVAGVADDHDGRVPGLLLTRGDEPFNDSSELGGGDRGRIVRRAKPNHVQDRGPRGGTRLQHGDEGVGPARN